jgi:dynein heavy chain
VQPHLCKCFDNIVAVEFTPDVKIEAMFSAEGEKIMFNKMVAPNEGERKGNPEIWMDEVEIQVGSGVIFSSWLFCRRRQLLDHFACVQQMRESLQLIMKRGLEAHQVADFEREKWVLAWPGQIVLTVNQIMWTRAVEAALDHSGTAGLKAYVETLNQQLLGIVRLVRGNLSKLDRKTLGPLVVIDVHARDVIQDMIDNGIDSKSSFDWQAQMRYYWGMSAPDSLDVSMISATLAYRYEYLGNSDRLVITPLTDRCYRTLMGALAMSLGGAPEGPAGLFLLLF